jgi:hypothetical protein
MCFGLLLVVCGCKDSPPENDVGANQKLFADQNPIIEKKSQKIPDFDDQSAVLLRKEGSRAYIAFKNGGLQCSEGRKSVQLDGGEYYDFFCDDLDSREEINSFLSEFFTISVVNELIAG